MQSRRPYRSGFQPLTGGSWPEDPAGWEWRPLSSPPARSERDHRRESWGVAWVLVMAIILAGVATLFILELWLADRVLPGVYVWDVDVGGLTREEAMARLQSDFRYPSDRYPTLFYGEQTWLVRPEELGTRLDLGATVDAALAIGHKGGLLTRLGEQVEVLLESTLILPVFSFNPGVGKIYLSQIARQVNHPLRNASLVLGNDLSVQVVASQVGREVDEEATRQDLLQRISEMGGGRVALIVRESEPLLTDLQDAQAQVQQILSGPVILTAPDLNPWTIEPATLASWLILRPIINSEGQASLSVRLDPGLTRRFVQGIVDQVARPPTNARFRFDDASGSLVLMAESVPGQTLDITATVSLIEQAAMSEQRTVPLPLISIRPSIASEDGPRLGIVELLGEGKTQFAGSSASRIQNIVVGAAQFDGLLIPPGETFSFNHYLGEVTAEKGYEESIIIWGNTTRSDVGGGLCQVSSTAFRAAFWAGLPIIERWPHTFRVSYYEPPKGMDATIYSPDVDLKWVNDTGSYILIHTAVDLENKTLTFRYYGTNPGRTVEMDGPYESNPVPHGLPIYREDPTLPKGQVKQIEWPKDGLDVTVYRIIKVNGVEVRRESFFSRYHPWQAVYLVGTKEE
ncbi:MAG: VanW family protein [Anaerolineae bacterium]